MPSRSAVAHPQTGATTATHGKALQQGVTPPSSTGWRGSRTVLIGVEALAVGEELLPCDVGWVGVTQTNRPLLNGDLHDPTVGYVGLAARRVRRGAAPGVSPRIGRVFQDVEHAIGLGTDPDNGQGG